MNSPIVPRKGSINFPSSLFSQFKSRRVLVVGDLMLDHYAWGDATRISPEAPVPVIDLFRDTWTAGGAANVALNIASLSASCVLVGSIGRDASSQKLHAVLKEHGVHLVPSYAGGPTILKTRVMVQHQQLCRLDREAAPEVYRIKPDDLKRLVAHHLERCDAVILSDYAKGVLTDELVETVSDAARRAGKFVALDPKPKRRLKFHALDLITPNRREALELAELQIPPHAPFPAEEVCRRLHDRFATKHLVVTLGEDGMLISEKGRVLQVIRTTAREVYDVSGAGDTALCALVLALISGASLNEAAHFANAAAGVVVGKLGTATVTLEEIADHLTKPLPRQPKVRNGSIQIAQK